MFQLRGYVQRDVFGAECGAAFLRRVFHRRFAVGVQRQSTIGEISSFTKPMFVFVIFCDKYPLFTVHFRRDRFGAHVRVIHVLLCRRSSG